MIRQAVLMLVLLLSLGQGGADRLADQTSLGGNLYLVNQTYRLTEHYRPPDLVRPAVRGAGSSILMREEAAKSLETMFAAAKEEGYQLVAISGFRSYETQRVIYQRKIRTVGAAKAALLVAQPGSSEHQLGLAMDLGRKASANLNQAFGRSKEGQWVAQNAHRFGFIVRYKAEWTEVTGYADEPWHIRYVGMAHAEEIVRRNIPLEEYAAELAQHVYGEFLTDAAR